MWLWQIFNKIVSDVTTCSTVWFGNVTDVSLMKKHLAGQAHLPQNPETKWTTTKAAPKKWNTTISQDEQDTILQPNELSVMPRFRTIKTELIITRLVF